FPSLRARVEDSDEEVPRTRRRDPPWMPPKQRPMPEQSEDDGSPSLSPPGARGIPPLPYLAFPAQCGPQATAIIRSIDQDLAANIDAPEEDRKRMMRKYLMRWHPDKNQDESKDTTTAVIQHLYARKAWFVQEASPAETAPLLA
ncbi:unnamed protein product, partial [Symbiodinium pilosum]